MRFLLHGVVKLLAIMAAVDLAFVLVVLAISLVWFLWVGLRMLF